MNCTDARAAMLEADPADLAPGGGSGLGMHLAACARCRAAAAAIVSAEDALGRRLASVRPRMDESVAVARAADAARRRARLRWAAASGALAAAAAAALLLLPSRRPAGPPLASAAPAARAGFSVTASPGQSLVVLQPADSTIVVVWFLSSRRSS